MTDRATRPDRDDAGVARPAPEWAIAVACAALLATASVAFGRVFLGWEFLRPVGAAVLLSLGGQLLARRAGAGGLAGLAVGLVAWAMFVSLAFLPSATLLGGVLPTPDTVRAAAAMFARGVELMQTRPPPTFAEPELLVMVVTGVWWIAHAVDVLAIRLRSPLHAIAAALVLWTVPLALTHGSDAHPWPWAVPVLAAAVVLLLVSSRAAGEHAMRVVRGGRRAGAPLAGWATGTAAVLVGALLVSHVPGFGEEPLVRPGGGGGGLTRTDNPIVDIKPSLVDQSDEPVAHVQAEQPVYLRWTSLDRYTANERWTNDGLAGARLDEPLRWEAEIPFNREVEVEVEVQATGLRGQVLVPAPYHPRGVDSPRADDMRWDPEMATLTMAGGEPLELGDTYRVTAAVPDPPPEQLRTVDVSAAPEALTHLPSVPEEVAAAAERIVEAAGAESAFDKAMALQTELRSWQYSTNPPPGHSGSDMVDFVNSQVGYCEQYAGTMAVMLRSLDIPARVAVGFTPGDALGEDEFLVRRRHAHAWVEVLFPGFGWLPFEPTPRDDGNLLTPSAQNLTPTQLDSERWAAEREGDVGFGEDEVPRPEDLESEPPEVDVDDETEAGGDGAGADDGEGGAAPWWWLAAAAVGLTGAGTALARRHARGDPEVPAEAVLTRVQRVERLGAGLGRPRAPHETDAEYIRAIAGGPDRAEPLIAAADRARWAQGVPREAAAAAAEAEAALRRARLAGLGWLTRAVVRARGRWHAIREWLRTRLRRRR